MKRPLTENDSSSTITKKLKIEAKDFFICRKCQYEIARGQYFLSRVQLGTTFGLFLNVFNVHQDHSGDTGSGDFTAKVFCSKCKTYLGRFIVRESAFGQAWKLVVRRLYEVVLEKRRQELSVWVIIPSVDVQILILGICSLQQFWK